MEKSFLFVDVESPTWLAYVAFLVIAVYFRFTRIPTIRNLDLTLLLLLSTAIVITGVYSKARHKAETDIVETAESLAEVKPGQPEVVSSASTDISNRSPSAEPVVAPVSPASELALTESATEAPTPPESTPAVDTSVVDTAASVETAEATQSQTQSDKTDVGAAEIAAEASKVLMYFGKPLHPIYAWGSTILMGLTLLLLVRLIFDESFTRRPRLDQNLNQSGITFLCIPAFLILMISVLSNDPTGTTFKAMQHGMALLERRDVKVDPKFNPGEQPAPTETLIAAGGAAMAQLSGNLPKSTVENPVTMGLAEAWLARILVVIAHTLVVAGLLSIGRQHFASLQLGFSMSCLYLLLPCTAVNVHELNHVLPAACLVWAIASYRNPVVSGVLLGLASGTLFFAAFLLPLWAVFYGRQGGVRFMVSVLGIGAVLITSLMMISGDASSFTNKLVTTANWTVYRLLDDSTAASDDSLSQLFIRIPMAAVFFVMLTAMTVLPRPRNLENLLSNSTCLVVAAQMWYPDDIGTYVLWYLPLFLLVIFRPRLDRFVPPEAVDRESTALSSPTSNAPASTVALSGLSFFRQR